MQYALEIFSNRTFIHFMYLTWAITTAINIRWVGRLVTGERFAKVRKTENEHCTASLLESFGISCIRIERIFLHALHINLMHFEMGTQLRWCFFMLRICFIIIIVIFFICCSKSLTRNSSVFVIEFVHLICSKLLIVLKKINRKELCCHCMNFESMKMSWIDAGCQHETV